MSQSSTPEAVALVTAVFQDKTSGDPARFLDHFSQDQVTYGDGTRGAKYSSWTELQDAIAPVIPTWPATARAYPTKILGDDRSAMVFYVDSPEMFGSEIRLIAPIDFRDGRIVRQVDYWDGRHFSTATTQAIRSPADEFVTDFGESATGEQAPAALREIVTALSKALSDGDPAAAAALFTTDATVEDLTLRIAITGRPAIEGFLTRALGLLPYGIGTSVRHTVGNVHGGGYEWTRTDGPVTQGVIALELDEGRIARLTTVWDGSLVDDETLVTLLASTLEH